MAKGALLELQMTESGSSVEAFRLFRRAAELYATSGDPQASVETLLWRTRCWPRTAGRDEDAGRSRGVGHGEGLAPLIRLPSAGSVSEPIRLSEERVAGPAVEIPRAEEHPSPELSIALHYLANASVDLRDWEEVCDALERKCVGGSGTRDIRVQR